MNLNAVTFKRKCYAGLNGLNLVGELYGDTTCPSVILAHGGGQTRHSWGKTAKALAAGGWCVLTYDHRGHGDSDWAEDGDYTFDAFARDLQCIAESMHDKPVVVGASLGGIAAMLAGGELNTDLFSAIILVDVIPEMRQQGVLDIKNFMVETMREGFRSLDEAAEVISTYTGRAKRNNYNTIKKNLRISKDNLYRWHWDPEMMNTLQADGLSGERLNLALKCIKAPVMLVYGCRSDVVKKEEVDKFLSVFPEVECVGVSNAAHMIAGDDNDNFTKIVERFLMNMKGNV